VIVKATNGVEIAIFVAGVEVSIVIHRPGEVEPVVATVTTNHCQALELAVSAARMEADARLAGS
jgi:hypothetical protein